MTTRKELIERIQAMQLGTQEMLDAAADDATLIPFETLFVLKETGRVVSRDANRLDDEASVAFSGFDSRPFCRASCLSPMTEY